MDRTAPVPRTMSIGELAERAGLSTRTLRHYESIGLLRPARSANGYRAYSPADARRLAQIQAMKLCGLPLGTIGELLADDCSLYDALIRHLQALRAQGRSLEEAVAHTEAAIRAIERIEHMGTEDAFEEMKAQTLRDAEAAYGREARERYGAEAVEAANERMMALTQDEWDAKGLLEESIKVQLRLALAAGDPAGEAAAELVRMHERWVALHWGGIADKQAYLALVRSYLADPRFIAYYDDAAGEGATAFLVAAVESFQGSR